MARTKSKSTHVGTTKTFIGNVVPFSKEERRQQLAARERDRELRFYGGAAALAKDKASGEHVRKNHEIVDQLKAGVTHIQIQRPLPEQLTQNDAGFMVYKDTGAFPEWTLVLCHEINGDVYLTFPYPEAVSEAVLRIVGDC